MSDEPTIIIGGDVGYHNSQPAKTRTRANEKFATRLVIAAEEHV